MTDQIAEQLQNAAVYAPVWGFFFIFLFMTIESSFIPFPSEVVMIPAGFLAMRGEMTTGIWWLDSLLAILIGTAGCLAGAYVNYFLAEKLGRTLLYRYGKYFFLKPETLERSEEIFREYGEITTFVCRLIPGIRQLISLPAGLAQMKHGSFILFTVLGAGLWNLILTGIGVYLGHLSKDLTYVELVHKGKQMISDHFVWILLFLVIVVAGYLLIHKKVMKKKQCNMKYLALILLIVCPFFSASADSPLVTQAENAQNIIDKTLDRMGYAWNKMKEHFSTGNEKVQEKADSAAKAAVRKTKDVQKKIPGLGK